jgi:type III secretion protein J
MTLPYMAYRSFRALSITLCVALGISISGCSPSVELLTDVPEGEVNEVLSALMAAGISASKTNGKEGLASIAVDQRQIGRAIAKLNAEGLPHERFAKMGEVFRKEGLISSPLEERARYLWALSQELSSTVSQIDGVLKARVHVVLPERSSGTDPALPSSAAVFIKYRKLYSMDEASAQIKRLVANSIPGLTVDKVSVILLPAMAPAGRDDPAEGGGLAKVWGYHVAKDSVAGLNALLVSMLVICICALGFSTWMALKVFGIRWNRLAPVWKSKSRADTGAGS